MKIELVKGKESRKIHRINSYYLLADGWEFQDKDVAPLTEDEKKKIEACKKVLKEKKKVAESGN